MTTAQTPRPAPARRGRTGRYRRLLACIGRVVRATHSTRVPF